MSLPILPIENLTKTAARDIARRVHGYFSPGEGHAGDYLTCPLCRGRVSLAARPYPRCLYAPSGPEMTEALLRHLLDEYPDSRCPQVASVTARAAYRG